MEPRLSIYLRTYRRRVGFTQQELAQLLGFKTGSQVSRFELGKRPPSFRLILGCTLLFRVPAQELFPAFFRKSEEEIMQRAYELYCELQGNPSRTTKAKLDFLEALPTPKKVNDDEKAI